MDCVAGGCGVADVSGWCEGWVGVGNYYFLI